MTLLRKEIENILTKYFANVEYTSSAKKAFKKLADKNERPDLVVSSYILDDGDIFDFLHMIKQAKEFKRVPVVMITSETKQNVIERAINEGVVEVIPKWELREKLDKFCKDFIKIFQYKSLEGTILHLEDSKVFINTLKKALGDTRLKILSFTKLEDAWEAFQKNDIDLVIVDFLLQNAVSGLDFVRMIRNGDKNKDVPIIVLTGYYSFERKLELYKVGADDFVSKPPIKEELMVKVYNYISKKRSLETIKKELEGYKERCIKDPLTDLYNRSVIEEFLVKEMDRAKRYGYDISFIMLDVDNFKSINDNYGHLTGDEVLKHIAQIVKKSIRSSDYAIRYGGEELLLVLMHSNAGIAHSKAEHIRKSIEHHPVGEIRTTASFGVTSTSLHPNRALLELIELADLAVYEAKRAGKNRVCVL